MRRSDSTEGSRPRVVIEDPDEARSWLEKRLLEEAGFEVDVCGGRESHPGRQCLLVREGWCPFIDRADAVVCHLPLGEELDVAGRISERYPGVVVVLDPDEVGAEADPAIELLDRNPVERPGPEPALARRIRAALRQSRGRPE